MVIKLCKDEMLDVRTIVSLGPGSDPRVAQWFSAPRFSPYLIGVAHLIFSLRILTPPTGQKRKPAHRWSVN